MQTATRPPTRPRGPLDALTRRFAAPITAGVTGARSALYMAESIPLFALQRLFGGEMNAGPPRLEKAQREAVLGALRSLGEQDAENIAEGLYPLSIFLPERTPLDHATRYARLLADSIGAATRKRQKRPREFAGRAADLAAELPDYYRRNFHFQTDGYLSETSADLYEHQVEILFRGVADAMRRQVIPPLKAHFGDTDGRGLHFLEVASGCGTATRFVAMAFPEARITCVDLSHPYLRAARRRLARFERVGFMQGDATDLDLRDGRFDAVFSVFLFHELPGGERARVLSEAARVLRPGGLHVVADSLQYGDVPDLDWALDAFPEQFHEPFYRDYARHPIEPMLEAAGFETPTTDTAFLTKIVRTTRPD
ncbi:MAG: class I SAM-dependent methyltransferase [Myxococcota bacterium]